MASEETPASAPASTEGVSSPPAATPVPAPASTPTAAAAAAAAEAPAAASSSSTAEAPNAAASSSKTAASKPKAKAKASGAKNYSTDPALYIYTSLTAGNMHIVTATSRLETILRANRVPFKATDLATDEKARMLWGRRAGKTAEGKPRRLPALVQMGLVLGDITEIEEWNEFGELKQHVKIYYDEFTQPAKGSVAPVPKYKQPANKAPHPPAALNPPPPPPMMPSPAQAQAKKVANAVTAAHAERQQSVKSVAEEAAEKATAKAKAAKQARLEALREKVHGAKAREQGSSGSGEATEAAPQEKEGEGAASPATESAAPPTREMSQLSLATTTSTTSVPSSVAGAGLQSPTSGAWRETGGAGVDDALQTVQSPTSSSWKPPAETSLAETFAGARVASASAEEISQVESDETIKEETEPESEEDKKKAKTEAEKAKDQAEA